MAEFARCEAAVVACHASPTALDSIAVHRDAIAGRVAADELLLIGPADVRPDLLGSATSAVGSFGIVVDQTDAWVVFCVLGEAVESAFNRLSHVVLPVARPAFVQCPIAHIPGKVVASSDRLYVLAPSPVAHHVERRLGDACGTALRAGLEPVTFASRPSGAA